MEKQGLKCVAALIGAFALLVAIGANAQETAWSGPGHLDRRVTRLAELPDAQLKSVYLECSGAALRGTLAHAEVQACSLVYEMLLQRTFKGDFLALLAWSRNERHAAPAERAD